MDRTVYFHYCTAFPIIRTVLIFLGTFQLYVPYNLKKKSCNIYKYRTYNRHLRVTVTSCCYPNSDTKKKNARGNNDNSTF